ncbi:MAG: dipeptide epimerase [Bacteroidetes bacterium]|nr:MAG: dipeptide epimerase [Bacteroidota bacterium]
MSSPYIKQIGLYKSSIPLKESFIISLGRLDFAENIIVVIHDSTGRKGFGEASPFRTIHGETIETCFSVGGDLSEILKGKNPLEINECSILMDKFIFGNTSIKSAINIALHDLAAQHAGLPLYKFLGAKQNRVLQTDYTVSLGPIEKMAEDAQRIVEAGFQVIKVKLGEGKEQDLARMKAIREKVGMDIPIRIDANQGWQSFEALEILEAMQKFSIQHCEEPIARRAYRDLPDLRLKSPIPIMADETCFDEHDAEKLIELKACDSFNIKLGKSSGISKALKIVQKAEAVNMPLQIGGFLESRLGFTAAAHVALCCKEIPFIDFDTPLMFIKDNVLGGIAYGKNGLISVPDKPGLGAEFSEEYLNSLDGMQFYG